MCVYMYEHVNSMVNLGVVLGNNNDYAEAIPIYRRALKVKPNIMAARHNLGVLQGVVLPCVGPGCSVL